jgi:hypothetical protein
MALSRETSEPDASSSCRMKIVGFQMRGRNVNVAMRPLRAARILIA